MHLRAYLDLGATFDRSGVPGRPDVTGVIGMGGYLATAERWTDFGRRWRKALKPRGIEFFHMTDYESHLPPYDWEPPERVAFMASLVGIVAETAMLGVTSALVRRDFDSLSAAERDGFGNVYKFCAASCMTHIRNWLLEQRITDRVDYIFEFGDEDYRQGDFRVAIAEMMNTPEFRAVYLVRSVEFKTKADAPGLQTGDIAAYEICKHIPRVLGDEKRRIRESFRALVKRVPHRGGYMTLAEMRQFIAHIGTLPPFKTWVLYQRNRHQQWLMEQSPLYIGPRRFS